MQGTTVKHHVSMQGTTFKNHVRMQDTTSKNHVSMQSTTFKNHISTQGTIHNTKSVSRVLHSSIMLACRALHSRIMLACKALHSRTMLACRILHSSPMLAGRALHSLLVQAHPLLLGFLNGGDLLGHHRQYFNINSIELIKTSPCSSTKNIQNYENILYKKVKTEIGNLLMSNQLFKPLQHNPKLSQPSTGRLMKTLQESRKCWLP